jgi:hypothetical protein
MYEIHADELKVLNCLIHAEEVNTIITETKLPTKVVIDIVRHLFHYRYIKAVDDSGKEMAMFEIDRIKLVRFILSAKGFVELERLQKHSK